MQASLWFEMIQIGSRTTFFFLFAVASTVYLFSSFIFRCSSCDESLSMHMDICKCTSVISTAIFRKGRPNNCGEIVLNVDKGLNINYLTKKKKKLLF